MTDAIPGLPTLLDDVTHSLYNRSCLGDHGSKFEVFDEPLPANADVLDVARAGAPPAVIRYSKRIRGARLDYNVAARRAR